MVMTQNLEKLVPKKLTLIEKQEFLFRNSLQKIASNILSDAGFTIYSPKGSILPHPHNKLAIHYERNEAEKVSEIQGGIEGEVKCHNLVLGIGKIVFSYNIKADMVYFASFPERHSFSSSVMGTRTTEQQMKDAFGDYVSKVVLGHKEFFDKLEQ